MTTEELIAVLTDRSRRQDVIVFRQCLTYLLNERYGISCYKIRKYMGYDTATLRNGLCKFRDYLLVKDFLARLTMEEFEQHDVRCDIDNLYIDGVKLNMR